MDLELVPDKQYIQKWGNFKGKLSIIFYEK